MAEMLRFKLSGAVFPVGVVRRDEELFVVVERSLLEHAFFQHGLEVLHDGFRRRGRAGGKFFDGAVFARGNDVPVQLERFCQTQAAYAEAA